MFAEKKLKKHRKIIFVSFRYRYDTKQQKRGAFSFKILEKIFRIVPLAVRYEMLKRR